MELLTCLRRLHLWQACFIIGMTTSLLYLLLPMQQYSGDGIHWYAMIAGDAPLQLRGTACLLYPSLGRLYFYLAHDVLELPAGFALTQSMNALFGGAGIAYFASILFSFTKRCRPPWAVQQRWPARGPTRPTPRT